MSLNLLTVIVFLCGGYQRFVNAQDPRWFQYTTQILGNERHDSFLKLPLFPNFFPAINMSKPAWSTKFTSTVTCNFARVLVVKEKIYCISGNKVNAFDFNTGNLVWSYIVIGANIFSVNYVGGVEKSSLGGVIVVPDVSSLVILDASTGSFLMEKVVGPASQYQLRGFLTSTQNGVVSGIAALSNRQSAVFMFDINKNELRLGISRPNVTNALITPTICGETENLTIISDACGGTTAYAKSSASTTGLTPVWSYSVLCSSSQSALAPVCYKNAATGTYHVIAASVVGKVCYEFEANGDGKVLDSFPCVTPPLIHYSGAGNADFSVFETGTPDQLVVSQIVGKSVVGKELWVGSGRTFGSYVIGNYLLVMTSGNVVLKIYRIEDGKVLTEITVDGGIGAILVGESSRNSYTIAVVQGRGIVAYRF